MIDFVGYAGVFLFFFGLAMIAWLCFYHKRFNFEGFVTFGGMGVLLMIAGYGAIGIAAVMEKHDQRVQFMEECRKVEAHYSCVAKWGDR